MSEISGKILKPATSGSEGMHMHLKLISGTCRNTAAKIEAELRLINGASVEVEESVQEEDERGMTPIEPIRLEVDGDSVYEGYNDIRAWLERHHHLRVARRHSRTLREANNPTPAYA